MEVDYNKAVLTFEWFIDAEYNFVELYRQLNKEDGWELLDRYNAVAIETSYKDLINS